MQLLVCPCPCSLPVHAQALIQDKCLFMKSDKTPGDYLRQASIPMQLLFKEIRFIYVQDTKTFSMKNVIII